MTVVSEVKQVEMLTVEALEDQVNELCKHEG